MAPPFAACRICFQIEGSLKNYKGDEVYIKAYENLTGCRFEDLPWLSKFCPSCACMLKKLFRFKKKCQASHYHIMAHLSTGRKISQTDAMNWEVDCTKNLSTWTSSKATVVDFVHVPKRYKPKPKEFYEIGVSHLAVPKNPDEESWHSRPKPRGPEDYWDDEPGSDSVDEEEALRIEGEKRRAELVQLIEGEKTEGVKTEDGLGVVTDADEKEIEVKSETEADQDDLPLQQIKEELQCASETNAESENVENGNKRKRSSKKNEKQPKASTDRLTLRAKRQRTNQELEEHFTITSFHTEEEQTQEFLRRRESEGYLEGRYKCELCLKSFKEQKWMDAHVKKHEPPAGSYVCGICKIRCRTPKLFRTHRDANHTTKYSCNRCAYSTFSKAQALKHHGWHEGVEHCCQHCGATFRKHTTYMGHLRRAHPSSYICGACARSFVSAYGLNLHMKAVHKDINKLENDSTKCVDCDVTFVSHKMYIRHILISDKHKELANDILGCRKCGEQFDTKEDMEQHTHYKERKYVRRAEAPKRNIKCDQCDEVFTHPNGVYQHYLREHPDKPYRFAIRRHYLCEQCGKTFKSPGLLQQHALIHKGIKPPTAKKEPGRNSCRICGKTYSKLSGLFRHKLTHSGIRRHKCHICDKAFTDTSNLKQHVQGVHLNIRRVRKR